MDRCKTEGGHDKSEHPTQRLYGIFKQMSFTAGKLIEIAEDPKNILAVMMNFLKLGGVYTLNVTLGDLKTDVQKAKGLIAIGKYLNHNLKIQKKTSAKASCIWDLYHRPEFNQITLDLIHEDSLLLFFEYGSYRPDHWYSALKKTDNFPVLLKYFKCFDFKQKDKRLIQNAIIVGDPLDQIVDQGYDFSKIIIDVIFRRSWDPKKVSIIS